MALTIFQKSILAAQRRDAERGGSIYAPAKAVIYERFNLDNATEELVKVGGNVYSRDSSGNYQKIVDADDVPYNVYIALLSQTGSNDPTVIELQNDFSDVTFTWARWQTGGYKVTAGSAVFTEDKTTILLGTIGTGVTGYVENAADWGSTIEIVVKTTDSSGTNIDGILSSTTFEVKVYK